MTAARLLFKKKKPFREISLYEPIYQFYICDLQINQREILLIGKSKGKLFRKLQWLNISVISSNRKVEHQFTSGFVELIDIRLTKKYVEIEFKDRKFEKSITAMISIDGNEKLRETIKRLIHQRGDSPGDLTASL